MKKIIIHEDAEKELWHATDYYEDKVVGLGLDFENEIQKALISIQENPKRYIETEYRVRKYLLQKFPYFVYYIEFEEYIWIVAFAHTSRKPFYWEKRIY
ncbi:MAG TPA: type II toxin-antitoxin system RelE/ParE family toxin [Nitrospinae bacterium]|nr:type II toxin-antitoxin system RelE/ParE family toxin [Nitrospinota bacterium]